MLLVYIFHDKLFYFLVHYMQKRLIAVCLLISRTCLLSNLFTEYYHFSGTLYVGTFNSFMSTYFTINHVNFLVIMCRSILLLYVYLFHLYVSCLPFSQYTLLHSGTLYVGASYCFMSIYFIVMRFVYLFHGIEFYFLVHYM